MSKKEELLEAIRDLESDLDPEIDIIREIVGGRPAWLCNPTGDISSKNLPLHFAVSQNRLSAVKILLEFVPTLANFVDVYGTPAFFEVNRDAKGSQIAELLLDKMNDVTIRIIRQDLSILFIAVTRDWVQVVKK